MARSAEHEQGRRTLAHLLDKTLKDYYPEEIERRSTVCYHLADDIIEFFGGSDHFVTFDENGWFIEHSVPCRMAGTLGTCAYNAAIRSVDEDEIEYGRWRLRLDEEEVPRFEQVTR